MARFRRRSSGESDAVSPDTGVEADALDQDAAAEPEDARATSESAFDRTHGPFDESEAELADQDLVRVDLGSLQIPGLPGVGVQVEADPSTKEVRAVTGVGDQAAVQVQAFAAPRSEGLWDEIRAEMLAELANTDGAEVAEGIGSFGPEVKGVLPGRTAEGKPIRQPVRFVGIDGPRWFLRVVFLGRAAVEPDPEDALHQLVRETIVVRGESAMAPRDPLPLSLPEDAVSDDELEEDEVLEEDDGSEAPYADLDPFERGPEITETR